MIPRSKILVLWLVVGALAATIAAPLWGSTRMAWRCYRPHESNAREQAEVMHKLENATLALHIVDGPHADQG